MTWHLLTGFAALAESIRLSTHALRPAALSCQLTDPGCYIDDFAHKQLYQFALSVWQINRAGLVLARWLEDLRSWLIDAVLADAFTTLTQPVKFLFYLALIVAWLVFVISFMVQSFVDLRWVDLRRAMRPILLALFLFSAGGSLLKGAEYARLLGGSVLQQAAREAVQAVHAPPVPTENTGDMADASASIYGSASSCGTPARAQATMFLNDYDARYLWANADDIHCAGIKALAGEFYSTYYPYGQDVSEKEADTRQQAVAAAAQGGMRQVTGVFMTGGALIEQFVQLLFAVALALVWFGILLSLVFAVFVPAEALFSGQLRTLLAVLRASWLASFLLGLGLAVLQIVAESGNGTLVFICGLALIAIAIWQGKQALQAMGAALSALSTASGSAPQAVGGMLKGWATTAALVAGVAATGGGLGVALSSVGSTLVRRAGRTAGDNPLSRAAGRVLSKRVADRLDAFTQDQRIEQDADLSAAEAAWYERAEYADAGAPAADAKAQAAAAKRRSGELRARVLDRRAERARQARNFPQASQLRRQASLLRARYASLLEPASAAKESDANSIASDRAQLYKASDAPEQQRRVSADSFALAPRRARLTTLREKRLGAAKEALADRPAGAGKPGAARPSQRRRSAIRANRSAPVIRNLDQEIILLVQQIAGLDQQASSATTDREREDLAARLPELQRLLVNALERQSALRPALHAQPEALAHGEISGSGKPAAANPAAGLLANGQAAASEQLRPADGAVQKHGTLTPPAGMGQALPAGQAQRAPDEPAREVAVAAQITPLRPGSALSDNSAQPASTVMLAAAGAALPATASQAIRRTVAREATQAQPASPSGPSQAAATRSDPIVAPAAAPEAVAAVPAPASAPAGARRLANSTGKQDPPRIPANVQPAQPIAQPSAAPPTERRPASQPARAAASLALPQVAEARDGDRAQATPAADLETAAAPPIPQDRAAIAPARQPWKRGRQGES